MAKELDKVINETTRKTRTRSESKDDAEEHSTGAEWVDDEDEIGERFRKDSFFLPFSNFPLETVISFGGQQHIVYLDEINNLSSLLSKDICFGLFTFLVCVVYLYCRPYQL